MKHIYLETMIGTICIAEENGAIQKLLLPNELFSCESKEEETPLLKRAAEELREYFNGERREFSLPLAPKGTDFQQKVWKALLSIPYGETRSYKQIAEAVDSPKGFRAVGMANNRNPIAIIIPCHRVIGAKGELVGYGGGLECKRILLELEADKA
ncbi:MAG: methylated-DNA--[protein]-cysteine S-methyltransferase [Eubacteriales bacterium]|nr:methylated-DNA--[protein]-cysteine S-methyltransferase [Eubacteriales bacterium]